MASDRQLSDIKTRICKEIQHSKEIVDALEPDLPDGDLMYQHIFPYFRRPDTEQEKRTIICMRVNTYSKTGKNDMSKIIRFIIYVITHDDLQHVSSGVAAGCTRVDYIADQIELLFNRSSIGLSDAMFVSNVEDQIDARHPMRVITFEVDGWNTSRCNG